MNRQFRILFAALLIAACLIAPNALAGPVDEPMSIELDFAWVTDLLEAVWSAITGDDSSQVGPAGVPIGVDTPETEVGGVAVPIG